MKLSILICTLPQREVMFGELRSKLMGQLFELVDFKDQVEIRSASSIKMTTGALRNDLLKMAKGDFVVFIDDDDDVDGGVNDSTVKFLNVESVVSGSYILAAPNPIKNIMHLQTSGEYAQY